MKKLLNLFAIFVLIITISACDDNGVLPIFQTSYDVELGQSLEAQIAQDPVNYPLLNDVEATKYLQDIMDKIIQAPEILYRGTFAYKVRIINSNVINAFATPGGYIYVYAGLIKYLESEAEMAAILAHEIAHSDRRHSIQTLQKQYGVGFLVDLVMPENAGQLVTVTAEMLQTMAFMKNSRIDELEADEFSFKYLKSTNIWHPAAGRDFFQRALSQSQSGSNILEELLSTHPTDADRIVQLDELIKLNNVPSATEENLFKERYKTYKSKFN